MPLYSIRSWRCHFRIREIIYSWTLLHLNLLLKSTSRIQNLTQTLFQLTFVDDLKIEDGTSAGSVPVSSSPGGKSSTGSGPAGRQLVPGLLYIDDKTANINGKVTSV